MIKSSGRTSDRTSDPISGGSKGAVRVYQPWAAPVRAVAYDDPSLLWEMRRWVAALRAEGKVRAEFSVEWREDVAVGVLRDGGLIGEVRPSDFLVFGRNGLSVLTAAQFWRDYREMGC
ncbi:hypothetical protein L6E12_33330 [Actinokineospora sp. PR83]|uniref:hypothetical protein n=1 Tax=Actinokineospora sp. PR83 TaxID=2884908 RepID=UPI001F46C41E|nr:hypothetical protein [Actinokineospora sp. PR83]MCG8920655.1 hypothetical protein [Actinokineospora sp. PR83]